MVLLPTAAKERRKVASVMTLNLFFLTDLCRPPWSINFFESASERRMTWTRPNLTAGWVLGKTVDKLSEFEGEFAPFTNASFIQE
jgi:hypothetical protein